MPLKPGRTAQEAPSMNPSCAEQSLVGGHAAKVHTSRDLPAGHQGACNQAASCCHTQTLQMHCLQAHCVTSGRPAHVSTCPPDSRGTGHPTA
jgi:hypothetical protein